MDKLTGRDASGEAYIKHRYVDEDGLCSIERIYGDEAEVFTAYVESGATPEQVQEWAKAAQEGRLVVLPENGHVRAHESLNGWLVAQVDFGSEAKQIEVITLVRETYSPEYLAEAKNNGGLESLISQYLPCKIGDTVYIVDEDDEEPREMVIDHIRITDDGIWLRSDPWDGVICEVNALEHWVDGCYPVFYSLSREAAEAALKGAPPV